MWHLAPLEQVIETITQQLIGKSRWSDLINEVSESEEEEDEDAAVIRFVNEVVSKAVTDRATGIHFEPHRNDYKSATESTAYSCTSVCRIILSVSRSHPPDHGQAQHLGEATAPRRPYRFWLRNGRTRHQFNLPHREKRLLRLITKNRSRFRCRTRSCRRRSANWRTPFPPLASFSLDQQAPESLFPDRVYS